MIRACGFEWGSTKELDFWSGGVISSTTFRTGAYSGYTYNAARFQLFHSAASEIYTQAAIRFYAYGSQATSPFLYLLGEDRAEKVLSFTLPSSGILSAYVGDSWSGGTLVVAGVTPLIATSFAPFRIVEIHAKIDSLDGFIEVRVDGLTYCSFYGDTKPGTATAFGAYYPYSAVGQDTTTCFWDDVVINDTTGEINNSWVSGARILLLKPNAIGSSSQWEVEPSGMTHNLAVDDIPPSATEYIWSNTSSAVDLFALEDQPVDLGNILAIIPGAVAQRIAGATTSTLHLAIKTPTATSLGAQKEVALSWAYYSDLLELDPTTGQPWRVYHIDSTESGVKII